MNQFLGRRQIQKLEGQGNFVFLIFFKLENFRRYRRRRIRDFRVFIAVHNGISEAGSVFIITREWGTSNYYDEGDEVELKEQIIALVTANPKISTHDLSHRTGCSRWFV